jgi:hypothetical protein
MAFMDCLLLTGCRDAILGKTVLKSLSASMSRKCRTLGGEKGKFAGRISILRQYWTESGLSA